MYLWFKNQFGLFKLAIIHGVSHATVHIYIMCVGTCISYVYDVVHTVPARIIGPQEKGSNIAMGVTAFP